MQIVIPLKNVDSPWERIELEKWIRDNILTKGHAVLIKVACAFGLSPSYAQNICSNLLLHWLLDKLIIDSPKLDSVKCKGEKMGLVSHIVKRVEEAQKVYKIKNMDDPRGNLDEYMKTYHEKLAHFIGHKWAMQPTDEEGIDVDYLESLLGTSTPQYLDVPPPVTPSYLPIVSMEIQKDPSVGKKAKRILDPHEIENIKAEISGVKDNVSRLNARLDGHENRVALMEMELRSLRK